MSITRVGSVATLLAATLGSVSMSQAADARSSATRAGGGSQGEQKTALFGLFGCGSNCGYGCGCGYRACSPCVSYGGCYPRPACGYGGCGPIYGGGCGYYGSPVVTSPVYGVPAYGGGCGPYSPGCGTPGYGYGYSGYGAPVYGAPGIGAPVYGPYGRRSTTPSIPVVNRPERFRSTAFEDDQDSPFYP